MIDQFWIIMIAVGAIALLAGFIHSALGFGFGIVAVALLPLFVEMRQAHVVISTAGVPVLIMAAWSYRDGADWQALKAALFGAVIGMPLGLLAFEFLPIPWLVRGTGAAILLMVWMSYRNRRIAASSKGTDGPSDSTSFAKSLLAAKGKAPSWFAAWFAGWLGGFLAGAVSIAGPPVAAFALQQGWSQSRFKAFVNQFLLAVSVYKVAGLALRGFIDEPVLKQSAMLAPMALVGIHLGTKFSRKVPAIWFQRAVTFVLVVLSVYFLMRN